MFFNFALILFWLLAFVAPVGDYARYMKSFSDTRYIVPDKPMPSVMVSAMVPLVLPPAPSPGPRHTLLAVPIYTSADRSREAPGTRFNRPIYKFVGELIDHFANLVGRPRPTKTRGHPTSDPTKVPLIAYPAPPTPAGRGLKHPSIYARPTSGIDPVALWSTYKLFVGWAFFTFVTTIFAFVRFLAHGRTGKHASAPNDSDVADSSPTKASLTTFDSILDLYAALPSTTCENITTSSNPIRLSPEDVPLPAVTDDELMALDIPTTILGSASVNDAQALFADIDTKSWVEGKTDTNGTLTEGKTLEPAVSINSIGGIIGLYAGESLAGAPLRDVSHRPSPAMQAFTPRRKRWLTNLITRLQDMERQGNYLGRVYEDGDGSLDLGTPVQGPSVEPVTNGDNSVDSGRQTRGATEFGPGTTALEVDDTASLASFGFGSNDQSLLSGSASADHLPASVSKDSIDVQMEIMLGEQERMIFDQQLGARYDPTAVSGLIPISLKTKVEEDSSASKLNSVDISLSPSPSVDFQAAVPTQVTLPPSPSLEEGY
ncbi:unnamed protein product [Rhizoctonia solani]|uniref:Transmembrane protein n=1 Tax=Rhizoctonia solani TaxID=456999 RepID=A0A8H3CXS8_9AGAM|nr:unnamed protein product [Rhizoctonia solani]